MKLEVQVFSLFCLYLIKLRSISRAVDALNHWLELHAKKLREELDQLKKDAGVRQAEVILLEADSKRLKQEIAGKKAILAYLEYLKTLQDEEK